MLLAVVQEGTATKADLQTFDVAGKSGTARRTAGSSGYTTGNYTASFVGLFPGKDPQYVVLVKLDSPTGKHYAGGDIAAPVTRIVLNAALAARDAALNREDLAASEKHAVATTADGHSGAVTRPATALARGAPRDPAEGVDPAEFDPSGNMAAGSTHGREEGTTSYFVALSKSPKPAPVAVVPRAVPDVSGLSVREAVRALHAAGFRVRISNASASGTLPVAGRVAPPGTIVQLNRADE
jgi:cell division protein FtsI (penicillin-binding protein 3)